MLSPSPIVFSSSLLLMLRFASARRSIESPVAPSNPMYSAVSRLPSGAITVRSGESNILYVNPGGLVVAGNAATGGAGETVLGGAGVTGANHDGPSSSSASGSQAAIVRPSSIASP